MELKLAREQGVRLTDARGLAGHELRLVADLRPDTFVARLEALPPGFVELEPGEETAVPVAVTDLAPNANVTHIKATLTVRAAAVDEAAGETTAVEVTTGSGPTAPSQAFAVKVTPTGLPSNVQVRLDQGETIWTHGGTLEAKSYPLGDFAAQANAYLDQAKLPPGETKLTSLKFLVKSDTSGGVKIAIDPGSQEYTLLQTETWENPLDGSVRIDRSLELNFGSVDRIELDTLVDPPNDRMAPDRVTLDVTGDLGPERLLGHLATHDGSQFATVSSDYSVAQGIRLSDAGLGFQPGATVRVAGVTGVLQVEGETELYVELRSDGGGTPSSEPPIASLTVTLEPDERPGSSSWRFAAFDAPAELAVDRDYWVVFRGIRGAARLGLAAPAGEYLRHVRVNRGGQLWKSLARESRMGEESAPPSPLAAVVRLVYLPGLDDQTAAVELRLEGEPEPHLSDPQPAPQRITLEAPAGADRRAALVVSSHARGTLTLANVVQEFGPAPPGGAG